MCSTNKVFTKDKTKTRSNKRLLTTLSLLCWLTTIAQSQTVIKLTKQSYSLEHLLTTIESQCSYTFSYSKTNISTKLEVNIDNEEMSLDELLNKTFKSHYLDFRIIGNNIALRRATKGTISGRLFDKHSGEILAGAIITSPELNYTVTSNYYGFYSLTLPYGKYGIVFTNLGYSTQIDSVEIDGNISRDITMVSRLFGLEEVVVTEYRDKDDDIVRNTTMSRQRLNIETMKSLPMVGGETDIIKSLQLLPGVQVSNEGSNNLSVRGSSFDQNLVLLDEAIVYNPSHILGFVSTFNPDAIQNVKIHKGSAPAKYGGRLASVVDIRMKEGDNEKYRLSGGIGTLMSRLAIEGPVVKSRSSFLVAGRYSYAGDVFNLINYVGEKHNMSSWKSLNNDNDINFYDINVKFNSKIGSKDHIYYSGFMSNDKLLFSVFDDSNEYNWSNATSTIRWNHIFNRKLFVNSQVMYSLYEYRNYYLDIQRDYQMKARMENYIAKSDFEYFHSPQLKHTFGISIGANITNPGSVRKNSSTSGVKDFDMEKNRTLEISTYFNSQYKLDEKWSANLGLRIPLFGQLGAYKSYSFDEDQEIIASEEFASGELVKVYSDLEPRLSLAYCINKSSSVKVSYNRNVQFLHLLNNSNLGKPTDLWYPSTKNIKPQKSNQYAVGWFKTFKHGRYKISAEGYLKNMYDVVDFVDNADLTRNPQIESQILSGQAQAYGLEFMAKKATGKLQGWLSYTYSDSQRKIDNINNSQWYYNSYHKPHNLVLFASYNWSKRWSSSILFKYTSGGRTTMNMGTYTYHGTNFNYFTDKNGYVMDDFHTLDISIKYRTKQTRWWKSEWVLNINNVYDRKNMFSIFTKPDKRVSSQSKTYKLWLHGILPTITYNFRF